MATSRGITETKIYDRQAVIDRYGIAPELIPDFYGLKGDTSDNIPGVPGIGDKTASELIQSYGTLEDVLAHIDEIKGAKRKQNLTEHAEDARISKQLATVQRDVAVDFDVAAEHVREPDRSRVREVFREYELRDPLRRLEEALGDPEVAAPAPSAEVKLSGRVREGAPRGHRATGRRRRAAGAGRARGADARGRAVRRGLAVALRRRRRARGARRRLRRTRGGGGGVRRAAGRRARRQGARAGPAGPCPRHAARRLPAGAGAARLPVRRAVRRARPGERRAGPARRRRAGCWARSPTGSASRSQSVAWRG